MRFVAVALDYDGTLAQDGHVSDPLLGALEAVRASGRKLILVTGRHLPDLQNIFPQLELFDRVVVENGALLYRPATHEEKLLVEPLPESFILELQRRGVTPLGIGKGIIATWQPNETTVIQAIKEYGLDLQVIFNKGAVMVLPNGVNKGTGLQAALTELKLSCHNVVGLGDAENDHAFLRLCECSVAVANALDTVKQRVDIVTTGARGNGVLEVLQPLLENDLAAFESKLTRHHILLGTTDAGREIAFPPSKASVLVAGPSGGGKSAATLGILERLLKSNYQFCLFDPEADYSGVDSAITLGTAEKAPAADEVMSVLADPEKSVAINLIALPVPDRPQFFASLLPRLQELRFRTGRPHWIVIDEAHHLMPSAQQEALLTLPRGLRETLMITVHPEHIAPVVLSSVSIAIAVGDSPAGTLAAFGKAVGEELAVPPVALDPQEALVWFRESGEPVRVKLQPASTTRMRHRRKYAEGTLGPDNSFYFRGSENKMNLRAQNLQTFIQLLEGIDDNTWLFHLRQGDYSRWFHTVIKNDDLAAECKRIEQDRNLSPEESRKRVKTTIERHYTSAA